MKRSIANYPFSARLVSVGGRFNPKTEKYENRVIGILQLPEEMRSEATRKAAGSECWEFDGELAVRSKRRGVKYQRGSLCDLIEGVNNTDFWDHWFDPESGLWLEKNHWYENGEKKTEWIPVEGEG